MTQVGNHEWKRLKVGPRGGVTIYIYIYTWGRSNMVPLILGNAYSSRFHDSGIPFLCSLVAISGHQIQIPYQQDVARNEFSGLGALKGVAKTT